MESEKRKQYIKKYRKENPEKVRKWQTKWRRKNPEKIKAKQKRYYEKNIDKENARCKKYWDIPENKKRKAGRYKERTFNTRVNVLNYYGGKCACCGENHYEFLAIDHINGEGGKHRRKLGITGGYRFYRWIIQNNYPKEFRVLCHNCNMSLGLYGYCPHQNK